MLMCYIFIRLGGKMKKILMIMMIVLLSLTSVYGEDTLGLEDVVETSVKINDKYLKADTNHILVGDTVFVVGKYLVESFGGKVQWSSKSQTTRILYNDQIIDLKIGSKTAYVDGVEKTLYKAPFIYQDRTMIPLKFVSEIFACQVTWVQDTYTVELVKDGIDIGDTYSYERGYTDEDLYLLAKIVTVESGEQSLEMALAIANTVLNRVKDSRFPNSVHDVIYQIDSYVQFPPAHKSSFESLQPKYISKIAAKKALEGINNIGYSLYFNNQPFKSKSDDLIRIIDGEYFYY